jgi:hypothetical protein
MSVKKIINKNRIQTSFVIKSEDIDIVNKLISKFKFKQINFKKPFSTTLYLGIQNKFFSDLTIRLRYFTDNPKQEISNDLIGILGISVILGQHDKCFNLVHIAKIKSKCTINTFDKVFKKLISENNSNFHCLVANLYKYSVKPFCVTQYHRKVFENDYSRITIDDQRIFALIHELNNHIYFKNIKQVNNLKVEYKYFNNRKDTIVEQLSQISLDSRTNLETLKDNFKIKVFKSGYLQD